jgi:hypothetical protein
VDTGLNLSTVRRIKEDSVFDRTNFRKLYLTEEPPLAATLAYGDSTSRPGRPKLWRNAVDTPYVLNIYPAPDNQSRYLPVPEAPICDSLTAGGTLPARFYWIQLSFVDSFGNEGTVGPANKIFVPANQLVTVQPPIEPLISSTGVRYNRFNVYASATQGGECLQPSGPFQSAWTEPTSGLVTNTGQPPTTSLIEPIDGYLIEFKYYTFRTQLTDPNMQLQIPDDYIDVLVAGVNWLTNEYIKRPTDAKIWQDIYVQGIGMIRRDQNMYPHRDFIHSDTATINSNFPAVEVTDPSITRTN